METEGSRRGGLLEERQPPNPPVASHRYAEDHSVVAYGGFEVILRVPSVGLWIVLFVPQVDSKSTSTLYPISHVCHMWVLGGG